MTRTRASDQPRTSAAAAADDNDEDDEMEIDHILNSPEFEFVGNKTNNTILEKDLKIVSYFCNLTWNWILSRIQIKTACRN